MAASRGSVFRMVVLGFWVWVFVEVYHWCGGVWGLDVKLSYFCCQLLVLCSLILAHSFLISPKGFWCEN